MTTANPKVSYRIVVEDGELIARNCPGPFGWSLFVSVAPNEENLDARRFQHFSREKCKFRICSPHDFEVIQDDVRKKIEFIATRAKSLWSLKLEFDHEALEHLGVYQPPIPIYSFEDRELAVLFKLLFGQTGG